MDVSQPPKRYCIIGAGACGIAVVKNFKERGIPFDCFECEADIGGIWNPESPHAVYETVHLNTSKRLSRYTDFPMPEEYPQFLSRTQAQDYIRAYARHFGLYDHIAFNTAVEKVEQADGRWHVSVSGESAPRLYDGIVVANGHHWDPKWPEYPGTFDGEAIHAHHYKSPEQLHGKRVLIVGAGNSGCDIAADAALHAQSVTHSMRRSYWFLPKFIFGRPLDVIIDLTQRWPVPRRLLRWLYSMALYVLVGPHSRYGLAEPDHKLLESHPSSAAAYLNYLAHGRITPKPDIVELAGNTVSFTDGSSAEVDLIIYATGYHYSFPFMDAKHFVDAQGRSPMFLNLFHRELDSLYAVGLVQPADGGFWQLADYQARLISSFIVASARGDAKITDWFRRLKATAKPDVDHGVRYVESMRHGVEVQHYRYRTYIKKLLTKFGPLATAPYSAERSAEQPARASSSPPKRRLSGAVGA